MIALAITLQLNYKDHVVESIKCMESLSFLCVLQLSHHGDDSHRQLVS